MGAITIYKGDKVQESVNFPPTRAGDSSTVELVLRNNLGNNVEISEVLLEDDEVFVESITRNIGPTGTGAIKLSWKPNKDRLFPLNTKIKLKELIG